MIGFLVRGRVRLKIRIRVRVGVMFNISVYHWSNCRRSKYCTFSLTYFRPITWTMPLSSQYLYSMDYVSTCNYIEMYTFDPWYFGYGTQLWVFICLRLPLGVLCAAILSYVWIALLSHPDPEMIPHYKSSVLVFAFSAVIELVAEPFWVVGQAMLFVRLKVEGKNSISYVRERQISTNVERCSFGTRLIFLMFDYIL